MSKKDKQIIDITPDDRSKEKKKGGLFSGPITLGMALALDAVGMISYLVPVYAEVIDAVWAPLSAMILLAKFGKGALPASLLEFVEELLPGTDFIPTFTLMYLYRRFYKKEKANYS